MVFKGCSSEVVRGFGKLFRMGIASIPIATIAILIPTEMYQYFTASLL